MTLNEWFSEFTPVLEFFSQMTNGSLTQQAISQPTISQQAIVLGLSGLACVVSLVVLLRGHQRSKRLQQKLQRLERDLKISNGSAIGMGQHLIALEKQFHRRAPVPVNSAPVNSVAMNAVPVNTVPVNTTASTVPTQTANTQVFAPTSQIPRQAAPRQVGKSIAKDNKPQASSKKSSLGSASAKQAQKKSSPPKKAAPKTSSEPARSVYDEARLYLSQGKTVGNVAKKCGLSHAEVSLLQALSKPAATLS